MSDKQLKSVQPKEKPNPFEKLNIKQIRFLQEYVRSGKISASWMKVYKTKNTAYAYQSASHFLKKHPDARRAMLEENGINDMTIANALKDGFNAHKSQIYKGKVYDFIDPYARLKAAEMADKMLHPEETGSKSIGNQVNVQINTDGGSFRVVEN